MDSYTCTHQFSPISKDLHQYRAHSGCRVKGEPAVMHDRGGWCERSKGLRVVSMA